MARVAEAPRKSVGPGFELGRWSFSSCHLSLEQCLQRSLYNHDSCNYMLIAWCKDAIFYLVVYMRYILPVPA